MNVNVTENVTKVFVNETPNMVVSIIERPYKVYVDEGDPIKVTVALPSTFQAYVVNLDGGKHLFVREDTPPLEDTQEGDIWFVP